MKDHFIKNLANKFIDNVKKNPNNNAVHINETYFSYQEIYTTALKINSLITNRSSKPSKIIIIDNNDFYTYVSVLSAILLNITYIPLNSKTPTERNLLIIKETNNALLLSSTLNDHSKYLINKLPNGINNLIIDKSNLTSINKKEILPSYSDLNSNESNVYTIFTSGSTGKPKRVDISNDNLSFLFSYFTNHHLIKTNNHDRFLQPFDLSFDLSVFTFLFPISIGACCYVVNNNKNKYTSIIDIIEEHEITFVLMVPSTLSYLEQYMDEIRLPHVKYSLFAGEALYHSIAKKWSNCVSNASIFNLYGPTETTVFFTEYEWKLEKSKIESSNDIVPLGLPFKNINVHIINEEGQLIDKNEKGELCVNGPNVMPLKKHNKDQFINLFIDGEHRSYYKTGDIVSFDNNKNLIYFGRLDDQIKINGYRIELSEVEYYICKATKGNKCTVVTQKNAFNLNELYAFIENKELNINHIKQQLTEQIPDYMIPKKIILIDQLPLNINGKIDKLILLKLLKN